MKKILLAAAVLLSLGASAQLSAQERGKISVGGGLSYMTEGSWIGVGAKARYGLTDDIRLEGGVNYFLPKNNVSALDFGVNAHYVVSLDEKISVYPLQRIKRCYIKKKKKDNHEPSPCIFLSFCHRTL